MALSAIPLTVNTKTKRIVDNGDNNVAPSYNDVLRLIQGESVLGAFTFLTGALAAESFGLTDTFRAMVDVDLVHTLYTGTLDAAESGAQTEIIATFTDSAIEDVYTKGVIVLRQNNPTGLRERVEYTDLSVTGAGPYVATFTVDTTLIHSYTDTDFCSIADAFMVETDNGDINSGLWSAEDATAGKLGIPLDCSRYTFYEKYAANADAKYIDLAVRIEIERYVGGTGNPQKLLQDTIYARGSVGDVEATIIPTSDSLGSWAAADARYALKPTTDVTQTTHGLSVGDAIYNNAGTWTKAKADDADTLGVAIVTAVGGVNSFTYIAAGVLTWASHGYTVGAYLLVSAATAGLLTETAPTGIGEYNNPVAFVLDANIIVVFPVKAHQAIDRSNDVRIVAIDDTDSPYDATDLDELILADATAGAIIVNLPTPSADYEGYTVKVKNVGDGTNPVTIKSASGNIDGTIGTTGEVIAITMDARKPTCDGTNYWLG